ncbi:MAG: alpha/beta hydrolase [Gemmatimonadaceae bacterium]
MVGHSYGDGADVIIKGAETIHLQEEGSNGVLLLHGFGDTPQTLSLLATRLAKSGYCVYAPLLPGHGRTMDAFRKSTADEWIDAAKVAALKMVKRHTTISVVGLSMGGALAVLVAAEIRKITAVVLIAPYLGMPRLLGFAARTHRFWERWAGDINARNPRSIYDPFEREKNLAYGTVTGKALYELSRVVKRARRALPGVSAPTLIIQSREDPRVSPRVARFALQALGARDKRLVLTEGAGHIITVDHGRDLVFTEVENWLRTYDRGSATAAAK